MSGTPCRQCGTEVDAGVRTCPHCGCLDPAEDRKTQTAATTAPPEEKQPFRMLPPEDVGERPAELRSVGGQAPYWIAGIAYALAFLVRGALDGGFGVGVVLSCLLIAGLAFWVVKAWPIMRWRGFIFLLVSILLLWKAPWKPNPHQARWKAMIKEGKMPADYEGTGRSPGR